MFRLASLVCSHDAASVIDIARRDRVHADAIDPFGARRVEEPDANEGFPNASIRSRDEIVHGLKWSSIVLAIPSARFSSWVRSGPSSNTRIAGTRRDKPPHRS